MKQKIILASGSPRRKELLGQIGLDFRVVVSNVEERVTSTVPGEIVEELSRQKAEGVLAQMAASDADWKTAGEPFLIIGADTIVYFEGQVLGKPKDAAQAAAMLERLQGRTHEVYTGVTLLEAGGEMAGGNVDTVGSKQVDWENVRCRTFHEVAKVHFYPMTHEEIAAYVATKDPLDKAGSYGIQGIGARYIRGIEGDYYTVMGLPVGRLYQEIKNSCL